MLSNNTPSLSPPAANAPPGGSWIPTLTTVLFGRSVVVALNGVRTPSGVPLLRTGGIEEGATPTASRISLAQFPRCKSYARVRQARLGSVAGIPQRRKAT